MGHHPVKNTNNVTAWLQAYGYESVAQMQEHYGLLVDDTAGPQTIGAMNIPRCGVPDYGIKADCRWGDKTHIRYFHGPGFNLFSKQYGRRNLRGRVLSRDMIDAGFAAWELVTPLSFERVETAADADIWIGGGRGAKFDFDGPGHVLAWAYMPCGDFSCLESRFDTDERWIPTPADPNGVYAYAVWLHELGHLLGLDHSFDPDDIMAAYYNPDVRELQPNDVARIQTLYPVKERSHERDGDGRKDAGGAVPAGDAR